MFAARVLEYNTSYVLQKSSWFYDIQFLADPDVKCIFMGHTYDAKSLKRVTFQHNFLANSWKMKYCEKNLFTLCSADTLSIIQFFTILGHKILYSFYPKSYFLPRSMLAIALNFIIIT